MKIDRLYTLSQFIDYVNENHIKIGEDLRNRNIRTNMHNLKGHILDIVYRYNNFIKQKGTKDKYEGENAIFENSFKVWDCVLSTPQPFELTLEEIANLTDGQLKLKGVEI